MSSFLFYAGALGLAFGIFAQSLASLDAYALACSALVAVSLIAISCRSRGPLRSVLGFGIFLLLFCIGAARMEYAMMQEAHPLYESQIEQQIEVEGIVVREVERTERSSRIYVQVYDELLLAFASPYTDVSYGDQVVVQGTLKRPNAFETDLGRIFDYQNYMRARGVNYTIAYAEVETLETGKGGPLRTALYSFKYAFMEKVEAVLPQREAGLGEGLLLGVKQSLGEDLELAFRKTGITHIVVLSGYNVMLVVTFITYILAFVLPFRWRIAFGLVGVISFALLVGLSATVVRASMMAALLLVAQATGRTYAVVRALLITGICMLLLNPYLLVYDVGFQLSFIATLGLILLAPQIERYVHFMPQIGGLRTFLTATLATQLFVAPILLYQIGELSIVSVVVNVLVLPMVPVAMLLTFATGMVAFISIHAALPIAFLAMWSLAYILFIAELFAALSFASFTVPAFPFVVTAAAYLLFALWLYRMHAHRIQSEYASWTIVDESDVLQR